MLEATLQTSTSKTISVIYPLQLNQQKWWEHHRQTGSCWQGW